MSAQQKDKDVLEEIAPETHALSCMLDVQVLRLENPDREANILLFTMDPAFCLSKTLCDRRSKAPAINPEAQAEERIAKTATLCSCP